MYVGGCTKYHDFLFLLNRAEGLRRSSCFKKIAFGDDDDDDDDKKRRAVQISKYLSLVALLSLGAEYVVS